MEEPREHQRSDLRQLIAVASNIFLATYPGANIAALAAKSVALI